MEIIVQGHKIDTKDIWDIEEITETDIAGFTIKIVGRPDIVLQKSFSRDTHGDIIRPVKQKFKDLQLKVVAAWEKDKSSTPIFKV